MASKFIPFENALVQINGEQIFANSATLGVQADYETIEGITGNVIRFAANAPVRGTFRFSHYMTGSLQPFLNPMNELSEPLTGSFAGVTFGSGYIKSLSFSVSPFEPIIVNSEMDIYGELGSLDNAGDQDFDIRERTGLGHGQFSFLGGSELGFSNTLSFSYSVTSDRNAITTIGNELPYRVTKENVQIAMSIEGEDLGNILKSTGNSAIIDVNLYDIHESSSAIDNFSCTGQVASQNISVSQGGFIRGNITVAQNYLTGKSII